MWILKKGSYGLNQALRAWYDRMDIFLMSLGFTKSKEDSNIYFKVEDRCKEETPTIRVILLLYVNDLFLTRYEEIIIDARRRLDTEFDMKYPSDTSRKFNICIWKFELTQIYDINLIWKNFKCLFPSVIFKINFKI